MRIVDHGYLYTVDGNDGDGFAELFGLTWQWTGTVQMGLELDGGVNGVAFPCDNGEGFCREAFLTAARPFPFPSSDVPVSDATSFTMAGDYVGHGVVRVDWCFGRCTTLPGTTLTYTFEPALASPLPELSTSVFLAAAVLLAAVVTRLRRRV